MIEEKCIGRWIFWYHQSGFPICQVEVPTRKCRDWKSRDSGDHVSRLILSMRLFFPPLSSLIFSPAQSVRPDGDLTAHRYDKLNARLSVRLLRARRSDPWRNNKTLLTLIALRSLYRSPAGISCCSAARTAKARDDDDNNDDDADPRRTNRTHVDAWVFYTRPRWWYTRFSAGFSVLTL